MAIHRPWISQQMRTLLTTTYWNMNTRRSVHMFFSIVYSWMLDSIFQKSKNVSFLASLPSKLPPTTHSHLFVIFDPPPPNQQNLQVRTLRPFTSKTWQLQLLESPNNALAKENRKCSPSDFHLVDIPLNVFIMKTNGCHHRSLRISLYGLSRRQGHLKDLRFPLACGQEAWKSLRLKEKNMASYLTYWLFDRKCIK